MDFMPHRLQKKQKQLVEVSLRRYSCSLKYTLSQALLPKEAALLSPSRPSLPTHLLACVFGGS